MRSILNTLVISSTVLLSAISLPDTAFGATAPSLGTASTHAIVAETFTNSLNTGTQTILNGDICTSNWPSTPAMSNNGAVTMPCSASTGTAQSSALANLLSQSCISLGATVTLSGTYSPGCYSSTGAMNITLGTTITLDGGGDPNAVFIFRPGGALTTGDNSFVVLAGSASASNVFWAPTGATTLGAHSGPSLVTPTFVGNIFRGTAAGLSITLGHFANLLGRTLAYGSTVTTDSNTITVPSTVALLNVVKHVVNDDAGVSSAGAWTLTVSSSNGGSGTGSAVGSELPGTTYVLQVGKQYSVTESAGPSGYTSSASSDCTIASATAGATYTCTITNDDVDVASASATSRGSAPNAGSLTVVKWVINDSGGTKANTNFPLFANGRLIFTGVTNSFTVPATYTITETGNAGYTTTFSGDCSTAGVVNLVRDDNKICIVTNNDIGAPLVPPVPPLINVVKVPSPLALPDGPGPVTYTYTLRNIGTVPVTDITLVGDTCSPVVLASGDSNSDSKLDVAETWVYRCSTTLSETHTNTVVATGWANGISAIDVASATVVVGVAIVPPLIHVSKVPSVLTLPAGGGEVIYTTIVTNPGTVPLSNVQIEDDRCSVVKYLSGDRNMDARLDTGELWVFVCFANLTVTTSNTAVARGDANGLTARDVAVATVVVAGLRFPDTGFVHEGSFGIWSSAIGGLSLFLALAMLISRKRRTMVAETPPNGRD